MNPFVLVDGQLINIQFISRAFVGPDGMIHLGLSDGSTVVTVMATMEEFIFTYQGWLSTMASTATQEAAQMFEDLLDDIED
jgi:hypothetical protein